MLHLSNSQIMDAALDTALSEPIDNSILQHLKMCQECTRKFDWLKVRFSEAGTSLLRNAPEPRNKKNCLNEAQMEALLDKQLTEEESEKLTDHVCECAYCLENLRSLSTARKKGYFEESSPYEARMSLEVIRSIFTPARPSIIIRLLQKGLELISGGEAILERRMPAFGMMKSMSMPALHAEACADKETRFFAKSESKLIPIDREIKYLREQKEDLLRQIRQIEQREKELQKEMQQIEESLEEGKRIPIEKAYEIEQAALRERMPDWKTRRKFAEKKLQTSSRGISPFIELKDNERNPLYSFLFEQESRDKVRLTAKCLNDEIDYSKLEMSLNAAGETPLPSEALKTTQAAIPQKPLLYGTLGGQKVCVFGAIVPGKYILKLTHPDLPAKEFEIEIR